MSFLGHVGGFQEAAADILQCAKRPRVKHRQDPGVAPLRVQDQEQWLQDSGRLAGRPDGSGLDAVSELKTKLVAVGNKGLRAFARDRREKGHPTGLPSLVVKSIKRHMFGDVVCRPCSQICCPCMPSRGAPPGVLRRSSVMLAR